MQLFLINTDDGRTPPMENAYTANAVESGEPLVNTGEQQDGVMIVAPEEGNPTFVSATKARANREIRVTRVQENQLWEVLLDDGEELPKNFELHHSEARGTQNFYTGRFVLGATEEKVDWQVPQGGGDTQFIVNAIYSTETGTSFTFVECDKTTDQIIDAYKDGKDIVIFAEIQQIGSPYTVVNCVILRISGYTYLEIEGQEPVEALSLSSATSLNPLDNSIVMYQITVGGATMPLQLIQLTSPQQSS